MPYYTPVIGLLLVLLALLLLAVLALGIQTLMRDHRPRRRDPAPQWPDWTSPGDASWTEVDDSSVPHRSASRRGTGSTSASAAAWGTSAGLSHFDDHTPWRMDDDQSRHAGQSLWEADEINPASGLPMIGGIGGLDVAGDPYGFSDSSTGCDWGTGSGMGMGSGMGCGHDTMSWD